MKLFNLCVLFLLWAATAFCRMRLKNWHFQSEDSTRVFVQQSPTISYNISDYLVTELPGFDNVYNLTHYAGESLVKILNLLTLSYYKFPFLKTQISETSKYNYWYLCWQTSFSFLL